MDRNELVEKALKAVLDKPSKTIPGLMEFASTDPHDVEDARQVVENAVDAILPDVIEAVRAEAARIAEGGIDPAFDRELGASWQRSKIAAAIRAAALGDALEGGKANE